MMDENLVEDVVAKILYEEFKRELMPQIESGDIDEFKRLLDEKGILYTDEKIAPEDLTPLQEDYSEEKVEKFVEELEGTSKLKPLVVSEDYYILDGHHRWLAIRELHGNDYRIPIIRVHLPKHKALVMLSDSVGRLDRESDEMTVVGVYSGRFQPFHKGHYKTFNIFRDLFGKNDTYIGTSNKSGDERRPFNFKEKKKIINTMFDDIPPRFIKKVKSPYNPQEILSKYDEDNTAVVVAVGEKDKNRLSGGDYYEEYGPNKELEPYTEKGYYYVVSKDNDFQINDKDISGSIIRKLFSLKSIPKKIRRELDVEDHKDLFEELYDEYNEEIFQLFADKLAKAELSETLLSTELIDEFLNDRQEFILEAARTGAAIPADDGPASWYITREDFQNTENNLARDMGYEILDYMFDEKHFEDDYKDFKQDALKFVSFFPTGVFEKHTKDPLKSYKAFADAVASVAGYEIIAHIGIDEPEEEENITKDGSSEESFSMADKETGGIAQLDESDNRNFVNEVSLSQVKDHAEMLIDRLDDIDNWREFDLFVDDFGPYKKFVKGCYQAGFISDYQRRKINKKQRGALSSLGDLSAAKDRVKNVLNYIKNGASEINESNLLNEGGSFGHLDHPFEDMDLTFNDLRKMINMAFSGDLDIEGKVREKTDGQNLQITWKDGELRAARNKGHLKNYGENSLDVRGIINKFEGRGDLKDAFEFAMKDLSHAVSKIDNETLNEIFQNGKAFMSLEVIYPPTQNAIPYGKSLLVFHGLTEYDENANPVSYSSKYADELASIIEDVNEDVQSEFKIRNQPEVDLSKIETDQNLKKRLLRNLQKLQNRFKLDDDDKVILYYQNWWEKFIRKAAAEIDYDIPEHVVNGLVRRWAYGNKSGPEGYSLRDFKGDVDHQEFYKWARNFDKNEYKDKFKEIVRPFEIIFLKTGVEVMKQAEFALATDEEQARQEIVDRLEKIRSEISASGDEDAIEKMKQEFKRLNQIGGIDSIVPSEGIIFKYKGDLYKLTGAFAPLNQILGIFKYNR